MTCQHAQGACAGIKSNGSRCEHRCSLLPSGGAALRPQCAQYYVRDASSVACHRYLHRLPRPSGLGGRPPPPPRLPTAPGLGGRGGRRSHVPAPPAPHHATYCDRAAQKMAPARESTRVESTWDVAAAAGRRRRGMVRGAACSCSGRSRSSPLTTPSHQDLARGSSWPWRTPRRPRSTPLGPRRPRSPAGTPRGVPAGPGWGARPAVRWRRSRPRTVARRRGTWPWWRPPCGPPAAMPQLPPGPRELPCHRRQCAGGPCAATKWQQRLLAVMEAGEGRRPSAPAPWAPWPEAEAPDPAHGPAAGP